MNVLKSILVQNVGFLKYVSIYISTSFLLFFNFLLGLNSRSFEIFIYDVENEAGAVVKQLKVSTLTESPH